MSSFYRRAVLLVCIMVTGLAAAEKLVTRQVPLADRGSLQLAMPASWKQDVRQPANGLPPTIVLTPASGKAFHVQITPLYSARAGTPVQSITELRANVDAAAQQVLSQSLEKKVTLKHLKGPAAEGYYFQVTDKAPKPDEYKYMTQGMIRVDQVVPTFTILSNDGAADSVNSALSMLQTARFIPRR